MFIGSDLVERNWSPFSCVAFKWALFRLGLIIELFLSLLLLYETSLFESTFGTIEFCQ